MTMIYLVQAEHWNIPGRMTKAFATERGAQCEAIDFVTAMLNDSALETVGGDRLRPCAGYARRRTLLRRNHPS
jgi:hypothetical protein